MPGPLPSVPLEALAAEDPRELGPYRLLGRLGSGGMGIAYLAEGPTGWAVVKTMWPQLRADPSYRARLGRELDAMRAAAGPRVAQVLDADLDSASPWFAMEFVPGVTLARRVAEGGALPGEGVRALASGLAEAVASTAAAGVVHRDLKPANVMLSPQGPVLIDFGVADIDQATQLTATGLVVGSAGWMAPEQITGGEVGSAADVHAWGLCVLFAATGRQPFSGANTTATIYQVLHSTPELPPAALGSLVPLVRRALAKEPELRPTPRELAAALVDGGPPDGVTAVEQVAVAGQVTASSPSPNARRNRRMWIGVAIAVVGVLALTAVAFAGVLIGRSSPASEALPTTSGEPSSASPVSTAPSTSASTSRSSTPRATSPSPTSTKSVDGRRLLTLDPASAEFDSVALGALCSQQDLPALNVSEEVRWPTALVQHELNSLFPEPSSSPTALSVTGAYSVLTRSKARDFQRVVGVSPSGVFDDATWSQLRAIRCDGRTWSPGDWKADPVTTFALGHRFCETPASRLPDVPDGSKSEADVMLVQWVADQFGLEVDGLDGSWSDSTADAIRGIQSAVGRPETGSITAADWKEAQAAYDDGAGNCVG